MSDFIPQEIIKEILYRLPTHSLLKCTVVCKLWHSLITSPSFISAHLRHRHHSPPQLLLRYFTEPPKIHFFSLHFTPKDPTFTQKDSTFNSKTTFFRCPFEANYNNFHRIVGCLHGLICLSDDYFGNTHVIILWNPCIKRFVLLPRPFVDFDLVGPYMCVLGFGFDSIRCDYKVVRLCYVKKDDISSPKIDVLPPRVELYSLKEGRWREISGKGVNFCICEMDWNQCFMHDCVHWIAYEYKSDVIESLILMFDMSNEKFKRMRLPENCVTDCPLNMFVADIGGLLGVLQYGNSKRCDVWVRKEYGVAKSWTHMYHVELEDGLASVLSLRPSGEFLVATTEGALVSYDPENGVYEDIGIEGIHEAFYAQNYTESLVLLDKESNAASYGGAKKKIEKKKKKKRNNSTPAGSELLEDDTSLILTPEETDGNTEADTKSARSSLLLHKFIQMGYNYAKFSGFMPRA